MASANLSFTKDGLIYRPQHFEDDDEDEFMTGNSQKDGGIVEGHVADSLLQDIGPDKGRGHPPFRHPCATAQWCLCWNICGVELQ